MTQYTLFQSGTGGSPQSGPSTSTSYTGNFIAGLCFEVAGGGCWFDGYYWWVCNTGQPTSAVKCALWAVKGTAGASAVVVSGSVVTSGTLTAGAWNYIPLAAPLQLSPGYGPGNNGAYNTCYVAAIGLNPATGGFPDTNNFWTVPKSSGPLHAPDGANDANSAPYGIPQGCFTTGGTDPSVTFPNSSSGTDNFWVDVLIDTVAPAGYSGSYRLWPNHPDANAATAGDAAFNYTVATEVTLSRACLLNNAWYFSPPSATTRATRCDVWSVASGLPVATIASPSWSGAAAAGWIKAPFAAGTVLPAGDYRVSIFNSAGTSDANWSPKDATTDYWGETAQGAGYQGITWGPLSAPSYANASSGYLYNGSNGGATPPFSNGTVTHAQSPFGQNPGGTIQNPVLFAPVGGSLNNTQNYWVDLEVTPAALPQPLIVRQAVKRAAYY